MPSGNEIVRPAILLLCGLPGAGKTTFASELRAIVAATCVESDAVRREIFPSPRFTNGENRVVFAEVERRAARALQHDELVIIDATNLREEHRARFHPLALRFEVPLLTVRFTLPPEAARARFSRPRDGHSLAGLDVYERMRPTLERPGGRVVVADSRYPFTAVLRLVQRLLKES